jgi:hypothetical protein
LNVFPDPPGPLEFKFLLPEEEGEEEEEEEEEEEAEAERVSMKTCPASVHMMIEPSEVSATP